MKETTPPQDRLGFQVGDRVQVKPDDRAVLPEDRDFYGQNVGVILSFLNNSRYANNGAALVEITQRYGAQIRVYIDIPMLIKVEA